MASSVFFKFKSQKEPTRVEFDGTGISVFELKRAIITKSGLGDGTDFDLAIYSDDGKEEYDDDTTIIHRSTTVIARRLPPIKPGAGRAARYVSGKKPAHAKNASRREQASKATNAASTSSVAAAGAKPMSNAIVQMNQALTEEEKLAAMFAAQSEQWSAQQEEMSHQTPVYHNRNGANAKRPPVNVPDHEPPQGYVCYRCGEKGHWIQVCPTNDNPDYDNRPRVKRTTGIPRSFLKTVDKATALGQAGSDEKPSGIMVTADGDYVVAEPDKAAWEKFQAKAKSGNAPKAMASEGDKELQERGLECSIDKKLFIDPMKTPCCGNTFCNDCISNALIESDFVCPSCLEENVLLDDLKLDNEASQRMQDYLREKEDKTKKTSPASPVTTGDAKDRGTGGADAERKSDPSATTTASAPATSFSGPSSAALVKADQGQTDTSSSKKRPAEDAAENAAKIPKGPKAMQMPSSAPAVQNMVMPDLLNVMAGAGGAMNPLMSGMANLAMMNGMNGMGGMPGMSGAFPGMPFGANNNMGVGVGMGMGNMDMSMMMMNGGMGMMPNMMMGNGGMNMDMNVMSMSRGGFPSNNMSMMNGNGTGNGNGGLWKGHQNGGANGRHHGGHYQNGHANGHGQGHGYGHNGNAMNGNGNGAYQSSGGHGHFDKHDDDDDAYFRKPVNPHRHHNRQRRMLRPSDYTEL